MTFKKRDFAFSFQWINNLIAPRSIEPSLARRERVLNILILGGAALGIVIGVKAFVTRLYLASLSVTVDYAPLSPFLPILFSAIFLTGYLLSRKGYFQIVAVIYLTIYFLAATYTAYVWGIETPLSLLVYALTIVMSGILIGSRFAFFVLGAVALIMMFISHFQHSGVLSVIDSWRDDLPDIGDAIAYSATFSILSIVSWLYNREVNQAFDKVYESEKQVRLERDKLEDTVEARTEQLKQEQLEKVAQMYRFVEFGREASGLIHDLVTPLHVISLNLESLERRNNEKSTRDSRKKELEKSKVYIKRAQKSVRELERFVLAARRQISHQDNDSDFSVGSEINYVLRMLSHRASDEQVRLLFEGDDPLVIHGNMLKFNQIIANLVSNAIDSYESVRRKRNRRVVIRARKNSKKMHIEVQDWGCGIDTRCRKKLFDPFFTTKDILKGTGIGLSITKDIVEKDFCGTIDFDSKVRKGSTFQVSLPLQVKH